MNVEGSVYEASVNSCEVSAEETLADPVENWSKLGRQNENDRAHYGFVLQDKFELTT
jgi:hypothetical protein